MPDTGDRTQLPVVDIRDVEEWKDPPTVSFDQMASFQVANWILLLFAGVYAICMVIGICMLFMKDATFDKALELVKFLVSSILPIVTLAVGYYLGDRRSATVNE